MPAARSLMPAGGRGQPQGREHRADGRKGMRGPHRRRRALRSSSVTAAAPPTGRTLAGTHASKGPPAAGPPPGLAPGSPSLPWSRRCCDSTPAPSPPAGRTLGAALGLCAPSTAPSPPKLKPGRAWLSSSLPRPSLGRSTPASAAPSPWLSAAAPSPPAPAKAGPISRARASTGPADLEGRCAPATGAIWGLARSASHGGCFLMPAST